MFQFPPSQPCSHWISLSVIALVLLLTASHVLGGTILQQMKINSFDDESAVEDPTVIEKQLTDAPLSQVDQHTLNANDDCVSTPNNGKQELLISVEHYKPDTLTQNSQRPPISAGD